MIRSRFSVCMRKRKDKEISAMDKEQVYFDNYAENWDRDRKADREK